MTPTFQHDCSRCHFLGTYNGLDLYHCPDNEKRHMDTLIARYGNDAPEYASTIISVVERDLINISSEELKQIPHIAALIEAYKRIEYHCHWCGSIERPRDDLWEGQDWPRCPNCQGC